MSAVIDKVETHGDAVRLNIGAGNTVIPGFMPIDRKFGTEAYPLKYADNTVDEIRASHILEHFSFGDGVKAVEEWVRVLKPGGRIRIAVPDVEKCLQSNDPNRLFWLMGGQTDENDYHKSAYDEERLRATMMQAGLTGIRRWESANTDTAALPISLNLEGIKPETRLRTLADQCESCLAHLVSDGRTTSCPTGCEIAPPEQSIKMQAYMTLPRYEAVVARNIIESSLRELGIGLVTSQGVFWGQCMQRMFEEAVNADLDWILAIDSDSLFSAAHLSALLDEFAHTPEADAMAALQCRRGKPFPLLTCGHEQDIEISDKQPIKVTTAHFGLTLIRVADLKDVPKPWFKTEPDAAGEYGDDRLDDDIWFWHQWRLAGKTIYVSPRVSIGHLEETVARFDDDLNPSHQYVHEWRKQNLKP